MEINGTQEEAMTSLEMSTTDSWVGRNVVLFPGDTYRREVHVIGVDAIGWEFEVLNTPNPREATKPGYRTGDRLFYSHSKGVVLAELDEDD